MNEVIEKITPFSEATAFEMPNSFANTEVRGKAVYKLAITIIPEIKKIVVIRL